MAIYKVNVAIPTKFAPPDFTSGLSDVKMEVYDEAGNEIAGSPFSMTEMDDGAATPTLLGIYEDAADFTPDAQGFWTIICYSIANGGKTAKVYKIEGVDVDDLAKAADLATAQGNITSILGYVDALPSDPADQSAVEAAITAAHATTNGKIDAIEAALPSDPADESLLEAYIDAAESDIRGADSDTLKTLSDQIDILSGGGIIL